MFKHLSLTFRSFLRPRSILRVNTYSSEHVRPSPAPPPTQPLSPSELPLSPPLPFPRCNLAHASVQPLPATQRPLPSACLLPRSRCTWDTVLFIFSVSVPEVWWMSLVWTCISIWAKSLCAVVVMFGSKQRPAVPSGESQEEFIHWVSSRTNPATIRVL